MQRMHVNVADSEGRISDYDVMFSWKVHTKFLHVSSYIRTHRSVIDNFVRLFSILGGPCHVYLKQANS